jgi:hypothetical protein
MELNETKCDEGFAFLLPSILAEDNYDIPWQHTSVLFLHCVDATTPTVIEGQPVGHDKEGTELDPAFSKSL